MSRLGWEGWSTWGSFLVTACLQGMLLAMGVYYEVEGKKKQAAEVSSGEDSEDEDTRNDDTIDDAEERAPLL